MLETAMRTWGPDQKRGAITVSFDNFASVSEIARGVPPTLGNGGEHITIERFDDLLTMVDGFPITYFIEGANAVEQPDYMKAIQEAGHEIALHGWRHEVWTTVPAHLRYNLLRRSVQAFENLGIETVGLRPPGGTVPPGSEMELADAGLLYLASLGRAGQTDIRGRIVESQGAWKHVDAYMLLPELTYDRASLGDDRQYALEAWDAMVDQAINFALDFGKHVHLIFHPQLFLADEAIESSFARSLGKIKQHPDLWVATALQACRWVLDHQE
jgi:peptidoglycan/xylan/chitin deacetylase (PgdA/CDA1 family)